MASPVLLFFTGLGTSLGINYGQIANNLPSPDEVVPLVKSMGVTKLKLYDADSRVLRSFANSGIEFIIGLGNEYLSKMASDPKQALDWVKQNVQCHLPATKITCISVGNEVLTFNDSTISDCLLPAMESVHTALVSLGLDKQVNVTTAHSLAILETSYPPSSGAFRRDLVPRVKQILDFQMSIGSPFMINAYPYFAYKANPKQVQLDFVLFQPNQGIVDPVTNIHYDNMLFAQIDAVYSALDALNFKHIRLQISETGWPSRGDADEAGATPENAKKYNENLIKLISQKKGSPMRPACDLNIYVFALFNENLKPGPTSERNYGLLKPDKTPSYQLGIAGVASKGNSTSNVGGLSPPVQVAYNSSSSDDGYMSITSGVAKESKMVGSMMLLLCVILVQLY
ncbi:hypothetical protein ACFE04_007210 [Oxalis oulophora]